MWKHRIVMGELTELLLFIGMPEYVHSCSVPEFAAKAVDHRMDRLGVGTLFIELGTPGKPSNSASASTS